ncbi:SDR family oxidoreductase [Streptomyces sp. NPDC015127]|uniref:SDR family oxidoreductase n=1 Tax=Streptomyces sp. NPDC015127 TaxID=3364939 RepID=UPI0036FAE32F
MGHESRLSGRVVLCTGAAGPAAAVTESLLARGARVAWAGPDAEDVRLAAVPGSPVLALQCGRDDLAALGPAVDTVVDHYGRLDHLVNLISVRPRTGPLMELDPLALRDALHGDLVMPLAWIQRAHWRWMAAHGGSVVNVVADAVRDGPQHAAVSSLTELTEWLAAELAPRLDVHTIVPSPSLGGTGLYQAGIAGALCDLLTRRTNPSHGPVMVLSEEPACPSRAA